MTHLAAVALLVHEYDEAISYFTERLGFDLLEDSPLTPEKRWVRVAPRGAQSSLLLARAATEEQRATVGNQSGGRVFLFLHTDDFAGDYEAMRLRGVNFVEEPRQERYGRVAIFRDLYGNRWDLVERASQHTVGDAEKRLRAAQLAGDVDALASLLDDDLVFTGPDGKIYSKADDLDAHRAGSIRITRLDPSDERIQDLGNVVVVTVRMEMRGSFFGEPFGGAFRYTRVWRAVDGDWRVVAGHVGAVA